MRIIGNHRQRGRGIWTLAIASVLLMCCSVARAEIFFIHNDHLGTPRAMTDKTGAVVWKAKYDPFGNATITKTPSAYTPNPPDLNLRFPGQYFDAETGLHYNYYRDYDPSTGRYLQPDPIGLDGGPNPYTYANNNPLRFTDPTGEVALPLILLPALPALGDIGAALLGGGMLVAIGSLSGDTSTTTTSTSYPERGSGRWKVLTGCNVNKFGPNCDNCPDRVFGYGYGGNFLEAKQNGEIAANEQLKGLSGCQKRHCEPKACWVSGRPVRCPNFK